MNETKLLSYVNGGYLDFALNWLKYIRELDMQNMVIMYCLDDESFERMSKCAQPNFVCINPCIT